LPLAPLNKLASCYGGKRGIERIIGGERDRASPQKQNELNSTLTLIIEEIQKVTESGEEIIRGGIYV
jgi:hypothetical protein